MSEEAKQRLRRLARQSVYFSSQEERCEISTAICNSVLSLDEYKKATSVLLYRPMQSEVDIDIIASDAMRCGKGVYYPVICGEGLMKFFKVEAQSDFTMNRYGIKEPISSEEYIPAADSLIVLPALYYDLLGYRLGHGGGYYDRFLSCFDGVSVGVCAERALVDSLPHCTHDMRVDILVTEGLVKPVEK